MNLSSYLQMPPAPSVSTTPSKPSAPSAVAGVGLDAGASLGLDFAKIMARQFQRLPASQRQSFAASDASNRPTSANNNDSHSQAPVQNTTVQNDNARAEDTAVSREQDDSRSDVPNKAHTKTRTRQSNDTHDHTDEATLLALAASTPAPTPTPGTRVVLPQAVGVNPWLKDVPLSPDDTANASTPTVPLRTIELSPHMRIITDPSQAPNPESLTAFAKSMGLDESTIQQLMGQAPAPVPDATQAVSRDTGLAANSDASPLNPLLTGGSPTLNGVLNANAAPALTPQTTNDAAALHAMAPAMNGPLPPNTPLPPTWQPMTAADMASIQQLQITVMPAIASASALTGAHAASTPSTASVLSLLGSGVSEQDIGSLAASFSEPAGGESSDTPADTSDSSGQGGFAQTMAQSNASGSASKTSTTATSATSMSEVYDQLSDKMATEMAARMHKQLSDGQWKMKFGLRPANLGGVEIQLEMKDGKLDAVFRADNPLTRDLLQNSSQRLRDALENFGIQAGQVNVGQGQSQAQQNPSHGSANPRQVGDNSPSQVKGSDNATSVSAATPKANASLLDLYA